MKQRIFSGIKPSGDLHIGNYLGAIQQWVRLQDEYEAIFCVVDLHAITVPQDPAELRRRTLEIAKIYLAAGIDPAKSTIFVQSHVPEHSELCWILNTITRMGDLEKMTQFKDKAHLQTYREVHEYNKQIIDEKIVEQFFTKDNYSKEEVLSLLKDFRIGIEKPLLDAFNTREEGKERAAVGLFDYPTLMAADIILYDTDVVPVGEDQVQHVELTRTLARRFNKRFGEDALKIPQPLVNQNAARIMALDNPEKKMSKSAASEYNFIALGDDPEKARKKIMKAVTDSGTEIVYRDDKPALKNLINIYSLLSGKKPSEIEVEYVGKGYADFKKDLGEVVAHFLADFQQEYNSIPDEEVLQILKEGAEKARAQAGEKMKKVKELVGFLV